MFDAACLANAGASAQTISSRVEARAGGIRLLFVLDTLEYLQQNGPIGGASGFLGTLLNTELIMTISDGMVTPLEKTRGPAKAIRRMVDVAEAELRARPKVRAVAVVHSRYPEQAYELRRGGIGAGV